MSTDGKLRFQCPHCNKAVTVAAAHAGKRGKCPGCGQALQIPSPDAELDFDTLVERAVEELKLKTAAHDGIWQLSQADWDVDQDAGTVVFTAPNGIIATCAVQIIGTYNTEDGTWLWGWDHPSVDPALQDHARQVLA
jgi:transcription elongation factor Elf1